MNDWLATSQLQIFFQLILAVVLGGLVGLEREYKRKEAGFRTYTLVCLGSALFTVVGLEMFREFMGVEGISFDPSRVIYAVAIGIGFIGGGIIVYRQSHIEGLTSAAGLWGVAAIGVAVGAGFYATAIFAAMLILFILAGFRYLEKQFFKTKSKDTEH